MRLMSGSGPLGPIFHGVWQSLQPATVTRYLPRASLSSAAEAAWLARTAAAIANSASVRELCLRVGRIIA